MSRFASLFETTKGNPVHGQMSAVFISVRGFSVSASTGNDSAVPYDGIFLFPTWIP